MKYFKPLDKYRQKYKDHWCAYQPALPKLNLVP